MNIPQLFAGALMGRPGAIKDVSAEWRAFQGIPDPSDQLNLIHSLREYGSAPADEPWIYRCMSLIADGEAGVPLIVRVRTGSGSLSRLEDTPDTAGQDLQDLLDNVNPISMTGSDLKAYTGAGKAIWGEAHWKRVRGRLGGPTQELHWLPAPDMKAIKGRGWIDHYEYRPGGGLQGEDLRPENVLSFRRFNLADPTVGLSPLSAVRYEVNVNQAATKQLAYTLANWGIPPGAWVMGGEDYTTQDRSLIKRALRSLRGPRGAGVTPVLPRGLEWKALALNPKDAEWLAARKVSRMTVCAALGVPLVMAGDDEKTTVYANLRDAERVFWRNRQIPDMDSQADVINNWLVPEFDRSPGHRHLVVGFDYSGVEALRPILTEEQRSWISMVDRTIITPNQYRRFFNLGEDVPWGDEPVHLKTLLLQGEEASGTIAVPTPGQQGGPTPSATEPNTAPDLQVLQGGQPSEAAVARLLGIKGLYRSENVRAFLAGGVLDADAILGERVGPSARTELEEGLRRRYSPGQIARGVPDEGFDGLAAQTGLEPLSRLQAR